MSSTIAFLIVLIVYSNFYMYVWKTGLLNLMPGYWYAIICLLAMISWLISGRKHPERAYGSSREHWPLRPALLVWMGVFLTLASLSYLGSDHQPEQLRALKTAIINAGLLAVFIKTYDRERLVRAGRVAMLIVVLLSIILNLADFSGVVSFSQVLGRAAGFYENPNIAGLFLVLGMILTVSMVPPKWRLRYGLLVGIAVLVTFSRSSVIMWLIALYGLSRIRLFNLSRRLFASLWAGVVATALVAQFGQNVVGTLGLDKYLSADAQSRIHLNMAEDGSVQGRLAVVERSVELIRQSWWVGHGLGAHSVWRTRVEPHNMFLLVAVEMGVWGLLVFLALFVVIWRTGPGIPRVFAVALFIGSLFSHNILDTSAVWLALVFLPGVTGARRVPDPARNVKASRGTGMPESSDLGEEEGIDVEANSRV